MKRFACIISAILLFAAAFSCSTTRVLQDGEYRLARNRIEVRNDKKFAVSKIEPYLKQKPNSYFIFGWNPFLNVYNWQNGNGKGWDKFIQKIGVAPVVYDPDMVESSIANVRNRLEYLGYYGSAVTSSVEVHKKRVKVKYIIDLGKRFTINGIKYSVPGGEFGRDFYADTASVTIRKGDFLSEEALEKETVRSGEYLRNMGYYSFNKNYFVFEADTASVKDSALLTYTINEYTRNETEKDAAPIRKFKVNNVDVTYPKSLKVKESAIRGLNTIIPGNTYGETDINNTYSRLSALRIFSSINIEMNQADTNLVDCSIRLAQTKLQGFKVNLETSVNSTGLMGISPQISYYHKNIFHGGEWLNLGFMGNFQFKFNDPARSTEFGVSASLSFPKFLGLPYRLFNGPSIPRTDVSLSYNYQNRPEYTRNIISMSYGYNGSYRGHLFYQLYPVQLNIVRLFDLDNTFFESLSSDPFMRNAYQNHFDLGLGSSLYYSTNTDSNPKTSFFYARLLFDLSGNVLSAFKPLMKRDNDGAGIIWNTPYSQYVRTELNVGRTWKFGRNNAQAIAARVAGGVGYAYGNSTALPFEKHFYVGGANSLRGWQARSIGPGTSPKDSSFVIPNQTGDIKLEANLEYRFKMFWKIDGAAFVDAGNVWTFKESADIESGRSSILSASGFVKSIAMNWGVGVRLDFDFLVVRVDLGLKLHDPSRDSRWVLPSQWFRRDGFAVHFGVGYPF